MSRTSWQSLEVADFSADALHALSSGDVAAVRIADFATPAEVEAFTAELTSTAIRTRSVAEVTRLGISQYEQGIRGSKVDYFRQAEELAPIFAGIFSATFSPLDRFLGRLRDAGIDADIMVEPGHGPYWAGNGKLRVGRTPIHVDYAPQDSEGWAIHETRHQLAWNLYLADPGGLGDLQLFDKRWRREDDQHQIDGEYFYDPAVVAGVRRIRIPTVVGDVVIINSAGFHAVARAEGRLAYGSFISVFADGSYRLWS